VAQIGGELLFSNGRTELWTFCSELLDAGVDIVTVSKLAGHASPVTTAKYNRRGEEVKGWATALIVFKHMGLVEKSLPIK
jgi:hypothetical protein